RMATTSCGAPRRTATTSSGGRRTATTIQWSSPTMCSNRCRASTSSLATLFLWLPRSRALQPPPFRSEANHGENALSTGTGSAGRAVSTRRGAVPARADGQHGLARPPADADRCNRHAARAARLGCAIAVCAADDGRSLAIHLAGADDGRRLRAVHRLDVTPAPQRLVCLLRGDHRCDRHGDRYL